MSHRLSVLTIAIVLLVPGQSASAAPSNVTVRVEGAATTLLERTAVRTTTATVNKDGSAGHDCTGTSAAGALEIATGGNWNGTWFDPFGYGVERILGETHAFPEPDFFSLWINNRETSEGICGATSELQEGDEVLFFTARCEFDGNACANAPVLPLGLAVPRLVAPGAPFEAKVVEVLDRGDALPGRGRDRRGAAMPPPAPTRRAARPHDRSGRGAHVEGLACRSCAVGAGRRSAPVPRPRAGAGGTPAAPRDAIAPAATLLGIRDGQRFTRANAPRRLRARVGDRPVGAADGQAAPVAHRPRALHVLQRQVRALPPQRPRALRRAAAASGSPSATATTSTTCCRPSSAAWTLRARRQGDRQGLQPRRRAAPRDRTASCSVSGRGRHPLGLIAALCAALALGGCGLGAGADPDAPIRPLGHPRLRRAGGARHPRREGLGRRHGHARAAAQRDRQDALRRRVRAGDRRRRRRASRRPPGRLVHLRQRQSHRPGRRRDRRPRRRPAVVGSPRLGPDAGRPRRRRLLPRAVRARRGRQAPAGARRVRRSRGPRLQGRRRQADRARHPDRAQQHQPQRRRR